MSKDTTQPTNPLFSPSNNFNFPANSLFMPVAEQTSAIFSAEPGEEEHFICSSTNQQNGVPTFSAFSNSQGDDPFSSLVGPQSTSLIAPNTTASAQEEPKLFVPSSTPSPTTTDDNAMFPAPASTQMSLSGPPVGFNAPPPPVTNPAVANPFSHKNPGAMRHRPMFVPNPLIQTSQNTPQVPVGSPFPAPVQAPAQGSSFPPPAPAQGPPFPPQAPPNNVGQESSVVPPSFHRVASGPAPPPLANYLQPVKPHWFYCKVLSDNKQVWCPFSNWDSQCLEKSYQQGQPLEPITTDGGRYDVDVVQMKRRSVYWDEAESQVRRCTWFWRDENETQFHPYDDDFAKTLEDEYIKATKENSWHKRIDLANGEIIALHGPQLVVHFVPVSTKDAFGSVSDTQMQSNVVKRGITSTEFAKFIPADEVDVPDHVVFFCHGIGPVCDLRKRSIVECVDDFRGIHQSLLRSHFKTTFDSGKAKRIEFLPIHWHQALHGDATGIDCKIRDLTLPSIGRLRQFTNETLLDILFYSSPVYCQTIAETVGNVINSLYQLFMSRNPDFKGRVSLAGHSLGSLILFDLLCHQNEKKKEPPVVEVVPEQPPLNKEASLMKGFNSTNSLASTKSGSLFGEAPSTIEEVLEKLSLDKFAATFQEEQVDLDSLLMCSESDLKDLSLPMGPRKKLAAFVKDFKEKEEKRKEAAQNVVVEEPVKPMDPVPSVLPEDAPVSFDNMDPIVTAATNVNVHFQQFDIGTGQPAVQYPQLDFKPQTLFAFGSPIGMFLTVRGIEELGEDFKLPTCDGFLNVFHPFDPVAYRVEPLINPCFDHKPILVPHHMGRKRLHLELRESLGRMGAELKQGIMRSVRMAIGSMQRFAQNHWNQAQATEAQVEEDVKNMTEQILSDNQSEQDDTASITSDPSPSEGIGQLNGGNRIDYVLQERPLESFNDYLFAFQSHLCYWSNEDTVLLLMKDIYEKGDVLSDRQIAKNKQGTAPLGAGDVRKNMQPPPLAPPPTTNLPPTSLATNIPIN